MKKIVIMPGGFHPFHAGHMALYNSARQAFPDADLYVAATNSQEERPFPFAVKEKLAKVAGVEPGHFIQVKSPFQAKEITQNYNPEQDVLIFVRSEKDRNESPKPGGTKKDGSPAYFQPWTGKDVQPFGKHAYFAYLPTVKFGPGITSATEIRKAWPTLNDKRKTAMVMSLYPAAQKNQKLAANIVAMLDQVMGGQEVVAEGFSNDMSTQDMIAYLRQHHDKNLHSDYVNHVINTNSKFVLKNIPLTSIRTELSGLDRAKVEQYKKMDFSKAPPIVIGSDGNILDGYHRATVAKALNIPSIKAYVGIKGQQDVEEAKKKRRKKSSRPMGGYFFPGYAYYGGGGEYGDGGGGGESVAEGVNDYLWHGSKSQHDILYPQQANDTGGKEESNKNAIYATPNAKVAIAMGLTTPGSDTGMFPNDPQMVLFKGGIRKGEMIYLHKVPKDLFIKHNSREWYSKPDVKEITPIEIKKIPVDKYLNLIRTATPQDLELQKKYMKKQGIAEGSDNKCPPATQDIELNLKNRQKAINEYGYGPLNPDMPNTKFWMKKVDEWNLDSADEAKQSLCGNCAAFDVRKSTLNCIAQGIDSESPEDAAGVIDAGELGYCKFLKFKCASRRTCDAWVTGGPLTDKQGVEEEIGGAGGGFGTNYPGSYEQENGPFIHKGGLKLTSLTTESVDYLDEK